MGKSNAHHNSLQIIHFLTGSPLGPAPPGTPLGPIFPYWEDDIDKITEVQA